MYSGSRFIDMSVSYVSIRKVHLIWSGRRTAWMVGRPARVILLFGPSLQLQTSSGKASTILTDIDDLLMSMWRPDGSRVLPARTCRDVVRRQPSFESGTSSRRRATDAERRRNRPTSVIEDSQRKEVHDWPSLFATEGYEFVYLLNRTAVLA